MLCDFPYAGGLVYINPAHVKLVRALGPVRTLISFSGVHDEADADKQFIVVDAPIKEVVERLDYFRGAKE